MNRWCLFEWAALCHVLLGGPCLAGPWSNCCSSKPTFHLACMAKSRSSDRKCMIMTCDSEPEQFEICEDRIWNDPVRNGLNWNIWIVAAFERFAELGVGELISILPISGCDFVNSRSLGLEWSEKHRGSRGGGGWRGGGLCRGRGVQTPPALVPCTSHYTAFVSSRMKNILFGWCFLLASECQPIGVQDPKRIPDSSMNASSYYNNQEYPHYGRLNETRGQGVWCTEAKYSKDDYLQIDMGAQRAVCAVATQGGARLLFWTTRYNLTLSRDGATWSFYQENNATKVIERLSQFLSIK